MKSHMLLASQNMLNYDLMLPKDVVFRINLAWCNTLKELKSILSNNKNVEFFLDLQPFLDKLPDYINIVPKIESPKAVLNIKEICDSLKTKRKTVMLDHDDLFSSIINNNEDKNSFQEYIRNLVDFCEENNISLLRTVGVMFSDDEKRITQYEK